jgi:hypothetical protein
MTKTVNTEVVEIVFGKIQLETALERFDSSLKLVPAKGSYRSGRLFEMLS